MKKRNAVGILLYLLGAGLFVVSNLSVVSGSPINLTHFQRAVLCSAAVGSAAAAPLVYRTKTGVGTMMKFLAAAGLISCVFAFGGFADNRMAAVLRLFA